MTTKHVVDRSPFKGKSLVGQKFGKLTVIKFDHVRAYPGGSRVAMWECQCDCPQANIRIVDGCLLRNGMTDCCGCINKYLGRINHFVHGMAGHPFYDTWLHIRDRCGNPKNKSYHNYGGRGIRVCERWLEFDNFYADMFPTWESGLSLDRFPNNNGNYEPGNTRWATPSQQMRNTRINFKISAFGEEHCLIEWAEKTGIEAGTIKYRIKSGWTAEDALTTPSGPQTIAAFGLTKTILEWSEITGLGKMTISYRINESKWTPEKSLTTPSESRKTGHLYKSDWLSKIQSQIT